MERRAVRDRNSVSSNKENSTDNSRCTLPRSSIVASKRPSPERVAAANAAAAAAGANNGAGSGVSTASQRRRAAAAAAAASNQDGGRGSTTSSVRRLAAGAAGAAADRLNVNETVLCDDLVDSRDVNLNNINHDCFIVPGYLVHRFLPEGISVSSLWFTYYLSLPFA